MKAAASFAVLLVTAPSRQVARALAGAALEARLAACVQLLPGVESHYWWQGRRERGVEVLMILKTRRRQVPALERLLRAGHPYDTPQLVVLPMLAGSARYLAWLGESLRPSATRTSRAGRR